MFQTQITEQLLQELQSRLITQLSPLNSLKPNVIQNGSQWVNGCLVSTLVTAIHEIGIKWIATSLNKTNPIWPTFKTALKLNE